MAGENMKKTIRACIVSILSLLLLELITVLIFFKYGYRITYPISYETSWSAVSAFADWCGVITSILSACISGLAIYFAIQVPKQIAARQDKIALFEKRFACYMAVQQTEEFSKGIRDRGDVSGIRFALGLVMSIQCPERNRESAALLSVLSYFHHLERLVMSGQFLFENYDCANIQSALNEMAQFVVTIYSPERETDVLSKEEIRQKNSICQKCEQFRNQYLVSMEEEMNLKK